MTFTTVPNFLSYTFLNLKDCMDWYANFAEEALGTQDSPDHRTVLQFTSTDVNVTCFHLMSGSDGPRWERYLQLRERGCFGSHWVWGVEVPSVINLAVASGIMTGGQFWAVRKTFSSPKIFAKKCKIWAETPHFGEIQGQNLNFEHP